MPNFENALVSRSLHSVDDDNVRIEEVWDLNHPDCPFAYYPRKPPESYALRWTDMTRKEYEQLKPPLK